MLEAKTRETLGKKVKNLRAEGKLPAVVYGKERESLPLTLDAKDFRNIYKEVGESGLVELSIDGKDPINVIIPEIDLHPVSHNILHANLREVSLKEKISAEVPILLEGESPAVKSGEGMVLHLINEIEVTCLPQDIPQEIKIDISDLEEIGDAIQVKELPLDREKIELTDDPESLVVKIDYAEMEEEEEETLLTEEELIAGVEATEEMEEEEMEGEEVVEGEGGPEEPGEGPEESPEEPQE